MSNEAEVSSNHSDDHIDEEWDVINADNELEQLKSHFEEGGVGASLIYADDGSERKEDETNKQLLSEELEAGRRALAAMKARVDELEHELAYADKARINAEQRNAQLCTTNANLVEEVHALTDATTKLKVDMEGVVSEKMHLEKNTVQLESFVEETIANSQSGYNFLCEARERVTDITREMIGLRTFLCNHSESLKVDNAIGFKGGVLQAVMSDLHVTLDMYKEAFSEVSSEVRRLKNTSGTIASHVMPPLPPDRSSKIALSNFTEDDVAMFFPTPKGDYVAFNIGSPHHYLSEESKALIGEDLFCSLAP